MAMKSSPSKSSQFGVYWDPQRGSGDGGSGDADKDVVVAGKGNVEDGEWLTLETAYADMTNAGMAIIQSPQVESADKTYGSFIDSFLEMH